MSEVLGSLPAQITASALKTDGTADTSAIFAFELSGAIDSTGLPIADPTTVATLVDNGDGTCTLAETAGAPGGASVNLDAIATDPAGSPPVSSAASGGTLTWTTAVAAPVSVIASVSLAVTSNPNTVGGGAATPVVAPVVAPAAAGDVAAATGAGVVDMSAVERGEVAAPGAADTPTGQPA
jgi:hypothetical protein